MKEHKLNCWEVEQCGLQPGGSNTAERGVCPAAMEQRANGIHEGKNAGRCCWVIPGTLCRGEVQGSYAEKVAACQECHFYKAVKQDEKNRFKVFSVITYEMRKKANNVN